MSTETVAEHIVRTTAEEIKREKREIENETNPEYKANRQKNHEHHLAWIEAIGSGKYVGSGSTNESGVCINFEKYFTTEKEALEEIARFPKFCKVKKSGLTNGYRDGMNLYSARFSVSLCSGNVTGSANETGSKRLARFLSIVGDYLWLNQYCSNLLTKEAFLEVLGKVASK